MMAKKLYLEYDENTSQFREVSSNPDLGCIVAELNEQSEKLTLTVPHDKGMVTKRKAERLARGITRSGYPFNDGGRRGRGYTLEIQGEGGRMPDRLKSSPREVY
ncbi:MAG: hypothetical protein KGY80_05855 [Candidatus Thorarchaeota archaeon]|nr:hypothetical protein [Candidatus Thorarchaeota archaeon]